jgi:cyanuric acid amidohydrolase
MRIRAFNYPMSGPSDVAGPRQALDEGHYRAEDVLCVIGKTEGNGGRNDFTRELAMTSLEHLLGPRLGLAPERVQDRIIFSFSGGTEGVVTPHMVVFVREPTPPAVRSGPKRLAIGLGYTRAFRPEEIGRMPQVLETARAVREVAQGLELESLADVHLVQLKGAIPAHGYAEAEAARRAGRELRCDMVHSRGASALGVALALGEVPEARLSDEVICRDWSLYSGVASCSAKPGLERTELLVLANSPAWQGELQVAHGVLEDMLDTRTIHQVAEQLGVRVTVPPDPREAQKLVGVFAKSEADPRGSLRGQRHTMLTDDDISDARYSRCVLSSVLACVLGQTRVYVSTRAEHHGPLGGGTLALVARVGP